MPRRRRSRSSSRLVGSLITLPFYILATLIHLVLVALKAQARSQRYRALQPADIDRMQGGEFEHYVAALLKQRGFDAKVIGTSGDLGVDIVASRAGSRTAIQVKRHTGSVSRRAVSDAVTGKLHYGCDEAMVITNGYFTQGARLLASSTSCTLIDRDALAEWVREYHTVGASNPNGRLTGPRVGSVAYWVAGAFAALVMCGLLSSVCSQSSRRVPAGASPTWNTAGPAQLAYVPRPVPGPAGITHVEAATG
jgi:restriction system protein